MPFGIIQIFCFTVFTKAISFQGHLTWLKFILKAKLASFSLQLILALDHSGQDNPTKLILAQDHSGRAIYNKPLLLQLISAKDHSGQDNPTKLISA